VTWFESHEYLAELESLLREAEAELMDLGFQHGDEEPYWEVLGSIRLIIRTLEQLHPAVAAGEPVSFDEEELPPEAPRQATVLRLVPSA
jgi:hypothetical protein